MKNETKAEALALAALSWTFEDDQRANRFLAVTGMTPDDIRSQIGDPRFLAECLLFLEGHEPDLLACADSLRIDPAALIDARRELER